MATVKDVAARAGVSVATVSRVLSGYPRVNPLTRERVVSAVEALNYRPDPVARSLRRRQSNLLGLVVSTIENVFFTEVARAAEQAAHAHGYHLILCNTDENPQLEATYLRILDDQLIAGIILAPAPGNAHHLLPYLKHSLPIVLINRRLAELPLPSITSNDAEAAFECVQQLIQQQHQRIAAITGLPAVFTTRERLRGYRRALVEAQLPVYAAQEVCGWASLQGGYDATIQLMQQADPPDALFCFNNVMLQGAMMALQELQIAYPEQVAVAGFGAFTATHLYRHSQLLIRQPTHEMGRQAVEMIIKQIEEGAADAPPPQVILQNELITGPISLAQLGNAR
ncbi:MAG: LacI family DNA-binding transcriptional regulator [Caldilineaceae bacterium]